MSLIRIENLEKRFGSQIILQNVNAEIAKGEIVSIIGASGSGKSTLLRAINFLDPPSAGRVYFNGLALDKKNCQAIRRKMGMVFQNFGLFSHLNVLDNLCAGPVKLLAQPRAAAEAKALALLKTVGLAERARHFPDQLSGGQKQRVAIARCLAMEPEVILFDEPTSALDPTMVAEVMAVIRNLSQTGLTMLIVSHEMSLVRELSQRILYLDEQGIYEQGPPQQIFENPQRPKTQAFIYKIQSFHYPITSPDFDNVALLAGIDHFCFAHAVAGPIAHKLRLIAEELVIQIVVPQAGACELTVSFSEKLARYEVQVTYPGPERDALAETEDDLAATVVRNTAGEIRYQYQDGVNMLQLVL